VFDPLDHPGIPVDRHGRHWREFDVEPVDTRATDPYTRCRISMMAAVEANAEHFDRRFASRVQSAEARRSVGSLGEATAERRQHLAAVRAPAGSAAEETIDRERAAFDMAGWAARNEREPDRSAAYRQQAWQHLKRLRSWAELGARAHLPWAAQIAAEVNRLWPPQATAPARGWTPSSPVTQPLSLLHDWMVQATSRSAAGYRSEPLEGGGWETLVLHESANCYLYYGFMAEEDDRRLRPMWELHLQMQLAHLRAASDLLRRYRGRDPEEVIGEGLPEPVRLRTDRSLIWVHEPDRPERGRAARRRRHRSRDQERPDPAPDVLELLTSQHARMNRLGGLAAGSTADEARTAFGDLAQLIAVHEVTEEQMIHPILRRLPDDHLADRLLDEESRISDALSDSVRATAHGHLDDTIGGLRDMVSVHVRREERDEFPKIRASVPVQERREMGRAVRAAQAAAEAAPRDPAGAGPRAVAQTADRVRDALAGFA
jgi:hemerythrin HHE cation binding domain-containing protein